MEVLIIAMTAHARREDRRKCLDADMEPIVQGRPEGYQSNDIWDSQAVQTAAKKSTPFINLESARTDEVRFNHQGNEITLVKRAVE